MGTGKKPCEWQRNHHFASSPATSSKAITIPIFQPVTLLLGSVCRGGQRLCCKMPLLLAKLSVSSTVFLFSPWPPPSLLRKPSWSLVSTELNNVLTANPGAPRVLLVSTESGGCSPLASQGQEERVTTGGRSMCPAAEQTLLRVLLGTPAPLK